jgi:hypothetical protein
MNIYVHQLCAADFRSLPLDEPIGRLAATDGPCRAVSFRGTRTEVLSEIENLRFALDNAAAQVAAW